MGTECATTQDLGCAMSNQETGRELAREGVVNLLKAIGEDPSREGLIDTPKRVVKAYEQMTEGMRQDPAEILSTKFEGDEYDELVIVRGIRFTSLCEHHLLPFIGTASVAYLPRKTVVGLSKIPRLVHCFARRLQLQERMTRQIAVAMRDNLNPQGVGVHIEAQHQCMACRGVRQQDADMVTTTILDRMRDDSDLRAEFIAAVHAAR